MPLLGVNIDHVATLRQARRSEFPDPVIAARVCERAGCDSIVCHLREDRRHINDADVVRLRRSIKTRFNLEMSIAPEIVAVALRVKPDQATLVPERRCELTTEGGLDVVRYERRIARVVSDLVKKGVAVSLFIAPSARQIDATVRTGARIIELHTGVYANAPTVPQMRRQLHILRRATTYARERGLQVNAGHGLNYENVCPIARIEGMYELNIGYAIIAQALFFGLASAVKDMKRIVR